MTRTLSFLFVAVLVTSTANAQTPAFKVDGQGLALKGPSPWIDVRAYGAKGDGVTDDTSAVQSALNAVSSSVGGLVYVPCGTYVISSTLTYVVGASGFSPSTGIVGADVTCAGLKASGTFGPMLKAANLSGERNFNIRNLKFDGNTTATTGLQLVCDFCNLENLWFQGINGTSVVADAEPSGGNTLRVHALRVENNYETNSRAMLILGDWVHVLDVVISKTSLGGIVVGRTSPSAKPYNTNLTNVHCFRVKQPCVDIVRSYELVMHNISDELDPGDPTLSGTHTIGVRNDGGNTDTDRIVLHGMFAQPVGGGYVRIQDNAGTMSWVWLGGDGASTLTHTGFVNGKWRVGDPNFYMELLGGNPHLNVDSNDFLKYDRSVNQWQSWVGGGAKLQVGSGSSGIKFGDYSGSGTAYACLTNDGTLQRSSTPCN